MALQEQIDRGFKKLAEMEPVRIPDGPERNELLNDLRDLFWDAHDVHNRVGVLIQKLDMVQSKMGK